MQSGQGFSVDAIRKTAEGKIMAAVDTVITRIPNGTQYRNQFEQAISRAMDEVQQTLQSQMGNLGGMMGNVTGRQGNPPTH